MSDSSDSVKTAGSHVDRHATVPTVPIVPSDSNGASGSRGEDHVTIRRQRVKSARKVLASTEHTSKIKVPAFSPEDPELWFALIEGQFASHGVTDDRKKFAHVINNLDMQYSKSVRDIIVNPPDKNCYLVIKTELVKRLSASHERKVKQLLTHEELGDRKPSQFLRHLQYLAGPSVPEDFLRSIWCNRLPHNIQTILASQQTASLEQLADLADRIQELATPSVAAASPTSAQHPSEEIAELKRMVQQLTIKLEEHTRATVCSADRSRQPVRHHRLSSSQRSRSNSSYRKYPLCWYHAKFGENARSCIKPCDHDKTGKATGSC